MLSQSGNKPLIAILTSIPNVVDSLAPHLHALPVELLTNPPNITFDIRDANSIINNYPSQWLASLNRAEIVISDPENLGIFKDHLSSIKWCQSTFAGPDQTIKTILNTPNLLERVENNELQITRIGSALSMPISEYVVSNIIRIERRYDQLQNDQNSNLWSQKRYVPNGYKTIKQLKFAIFGIGDIGCTIAKSLKYGFDAQNIIGLSKTSKTNNKEYQQLFNKCYTFEQLDILLETEELDYIICTLPSTKLTQYLLDSDRLTKCKTKPWLINVGRGDLIKTNELINSLELNVLSGVVLDVFEQEPLEPNNDLWNRNNVIITPHVSGITFLEDVHNCFMHNLDRYLNDQELEYLVDIHRGY